MPTMHFPRKSSPDPERLKMKPFYMFLTSDKILQEAAERLAEYLGDGYKCSTDPGTHTISAKVLWDTKDLCLSIEEFSKKIIQPSMEQMSRNLFEEDASISSEIMSIPLGFKPNQIGDQSVDVLVHKGISMRLVRAYIIAEDAYISRFDIRYSIFSH